MKKYFLFIALISLLSCQKEDIQESTSQSCTIEKYSIKENDIIKFLSNAEDVKNGKHLKTEKLYTIEEACNYIGATLNYTYTFPTAEQCQITTVENEISISISNNKVSESDLITGYNNAVNLLRASYRNINESNKTLKGIVINDVKIANGIVTFSYSGLIGFNINPIVSNDEYFWIDEGGTCAGVGDYGAPDIIEIFINDTYGQSLLPNTHLWQWPLTTYVGEYYEHIFVPQDQIDNFCDGLIYFAHASVNGYIITEDTKCLGYDEPSGIHEMEWYKSGASQLCIEWINKHPLYGLNSFECHSQGSYSTTISHQQTFYFGLNNTSSNLSYPIAID